MMSWWKPKYMIFAIILSIIVVLLTYDTTRGTLHKTIFSENLQRELKSSGGEPLEGAGGSGLMDPGEPTSRDEISAGINRNTFGS